MCDLVITLQHSDLQLLLSLEYSTSVADDPHAWAILTALVHIFECMIVQPGVQAEKVDILGSHNIKTISKWNDRGAIDNSEHCIHSLIADQCARNPEAEAVCAHDGSLTYAELNRLSDRLKARLLSRGIVAESTIPVCFNKSVWTVVSILGILKAGGAFLLLDPSHPFGRLAGVCQDVKADFIVTSPSLNEMCIQLAQHTVVVPDDILSDPIRTEDFPHKPLGSPENMAYVAYTSGSTGKPKGIAIEHRSFCSSAIAHSRIQNLGKLARVLQFASYSFDISIQEMLTTLIVGGCVCVPSESQRLNDLAGSIVKLKANWVELTPSVARLLSPQAVPQVTTLVLGGESMVPNDVVMWSDHVQLIAAYGPAECSVVSTVQKNVNPKDLYNIGRSYGGRCWVVDEKDECRLQPIGAIGELIISGPIVGRGYINQPDQDAFIDSPPWSSDFAMFPNERFYKTGDLVRYKIEDGTLRYVGRKDRQVKIHGQRVELQEIERQAETLKDNLRVVADVISPPNGNAGKILTLFIANENVPYQRELDAPIVHSTIDNNTRKQLSEMKLWLSEKLPQFMVPTLYIPIKHFPLTPTGKLDGKVLREIAIKSFNSDLGHTDLEMSSGDVTLNGDSVAEQTLRQVFSEILGLQMDRVGPNDGLFSLGGNSLSAIEVVAKARECGMAVTVANVLSLQTAARLATVVQKFEIVEPIKPFSLMMEEGLDYCMEAAEVQCQLKKGSIEDMYACTPLQEGLVSLSNKIPGSFIATFMFHLPSWVDVGLFKAAWENVVSINPILRTRVVQIDTKLFQAVTREETQWTMLRSVDGYSCASMNKGLLGSPLAQFALIGSESDTPLFILTMHHAVFDGWSYLHLLKDVQAAYEGYQAPQRPPFNRFIDYVSKLDAQAGIDFWKNEFVDVQSPIFPVPPIGWVAPKQWTTLKHSIPLMNKSGDRTLADIIKLAWALVMSCQTNSNDVVFGMTVSGRNSPVAGIENISGPTIATFPWRIQLQTDMSVEQALRNIQEHDVSLIPFEQTGMQRIQRCSPEAAIACSFQTLLIIQPQLLDSPSTIMVDSPQNAEQQQKFGSHMLTCVAQPRGDWMDLEAVFDGTALPSRDIKMLFSQFENIFEQIVVSPTAKLDAMRLQGSGDREQILKWNKNENLGQPRCIHDLICDFCESQPNAAAVCAWDGDLTYNELVRFSQSIAGYLQSFLVGPEAVVAICMDRSKWVPVAVLGVLMAGAAFVLLEPTFPTQRLQSICQDAAVEVAILSSTTLAKCGKLAKNAIVLTEEAAVQAGSRYTWKPPLVTPENAMYVAFTSGSTGKPKGVVIEHGMCYSAFHGFKKAMQLSAKSRVLFFSSPAFDGAITEVIFALAAGGCICIPSESDRLNNVGKAIASLQVTWLILTPSVSRILTPDDIPTVRTMLLVGESLVPADIKTWARRVELRAGYGPAECSMGTTSRAIPPDDSDVTNIGRPFNGSCWIVNPNNHHQLQPIGAIGEMMIGGAGVGRGYINRPEETKAAFIQNPAWASDFGLAKDTRFYKTGDLARYNPDGTFQFMGRKDTQVKLHGQRIELREIEQAAEKYTPGMTAIADLVALQNPDSSKIVLFVKSPQVSQETTCEECPTLFISPTNYDPSQSRALKSHLADVLPPFMIPSVILPIHDIPLTPAGKTDRKILRQEASKLDRTTLEGYVSTSLTKRKPSSKKERFVHEAFSKILSLDKSSVGVDDSFFTLGGDSISAMQVLSMCQRGNMLLSMPDFLINNTVALFCENAKALHSRKQDAVGTEVETEDPFPLSPTQEMFISRAPCVDSRFNLSFFLKLNRTFSLSQWQDTIERVIQHHSMLRTRLVQKDGQRWQQIIAPDTRSCFRLAEHHSISVEEIPNIMKQAQSSLSIKEGPLFSADLVHDTVDGHYVLFIAHHLVVDLVSWRVILGDIQDLLERKPLAQNPPFSFQKWVRLQAAHADEYKKLQGTSNCDVRFADYNYWGIKPEQNSFGEAVHRDFVIDDVTTQALLGDANTVFSTQPQELFQAALLHSWMKVFNDRDLPTIFRESHGRHPWDAEIDLSRTVGWFTTISPCTVSGYRGHELLEFVRRVKDSCRSLPEDGALHFISHFLNSTREDIPSQPRNEMEVLLNYAGRYQQLEKQDAVFSQPTQKLDVDMDIAEDMPRFAIFDVSIEVISNCLSVSVWFCKHTQRLDDITRWIEEYQRSLYGIAQQLKNMRAQLTLNDIPLSNMTYDELEILENEVKVRGVSSISESIEGVYPCSDAHMGLIEGLTGSSAEHKVRSIWEIRSSQDLNPGCVAGAWRDLVKRHSILRTILVPCPIREGTIFHVVLKEEAVAPDVKLLSDSRENSLKGLRECEPLISWDNSPCHFLAVCRAADGRLLCKLESGKAILDATSLSILLHELCLSLQGKPVSSSPSVTPYKSYITYLNQASRASEHQQYWQNALSGLQPSLFPHLSSNPTTPNRLDSISRTIEGTESLAAFWTSNSITATNIFQLAWSMVLHHYTGQADVCFGALASGRDIAMPDISRLVGPCFNVLPCRLNLDPERTVLDILRDNQQAMQHRVEHQHCSVPGILRDTGLSSKNGGQLFNTCLTVQPSMSATSAKEDRDDDKVEFQLVENHDPSEVTTPARTPPNGFL